MTLSLTLAALWVLASAITAMLPYKMQFYPGIPLLIAAIPLTVFVASQHGVLPVLLVVFAILSMYRRPLYFLSLALIARLRGRA